MPLTPLEKPIGFGIVMVDGQFCNLTLTNKLKVARKNEGFLEERTRDLMFALFKTFIGDSPIAEYIQTACPHINRAYLELQSQLQLTENRVEIENIDNAIRILKTKIGPYINAYL